MATHFEHYLTGADSDGVVSVTYWPAQTFTPSTTHNLYRIWLTLWKVGSPGDVTVAITATDAEGKPTGADLATETIGESSISDTTPGTPVAATFSPLLELTAGIKYAITVKALSATTGNYVNLRFDTAGATYTDGNYCDSQNSGTTWTSHTDSDAYFSDYGHYIHTVTASTDLGLAASASRLIATARTSPASMSLVPSISLEMNLGEYLCVASETGSTKTGSTLGASWTDCAKDAGGGLTGAYFAQYLNRLCVISHQNVGFSYSSANDIETNWTEKPNFPNLPQHFTDMFVGRDAGDDPALYFLTPIGMYYLDVFTNFVFGPTELTWEYDADSGKKGLYWKGSHYIAVGKGIYRVTQGIVDMVGPDMDDGLPEDMQGHITDMIGVGFWLIIAIDGGVSNKSSILKRYITGKHWHPVHVGSANTPISTLFWDSGTLYFGEGTNVKSLPMSNKTDNVRKLSTHTYAASGNLVYPCFHSEFEAMPKVAHKLRAVTEDCTADETITMHYRIDEASAWTELGSFTSSPRPTALPFPATGDAIGIEFETIQVKATFARGATTTNSPKLVSLILEYRVVPPVLWGWTANVSAKTEGDESGKDIIDALRTAIETSTLLVFYPSGDKSKTSYLVELKGVPGNEAGTEFGTEGVYSISLNQVVE